VATSHASASHAHTHASERLEKVVLFIEEALERISSTKEIFENVLRMLE